MINIIKSDLFRLSKAKIWIICLILIPVLIMTPGLYTMEFMSNSSCDPMMEVMSDAIDEYCNANGIYPYELSNETRRDIVLGIEDFKPDYVAIGGNYLFLFITILIMEILVVTKDLSCHSVKNTLTAPISRARYYFAKTSTVILLSLIAHIGLNLYAWIANQIINGSGHALTFAAMILVSAKQLLSILYFISIFNLLAFILQKSLPYTLIAFSLLLFIPTTIINIILLLKIPAKIIAFFPSTVYGILSFDIEPEDTGLVIAIIAVCVTVIAVANIAGYTIFRKREIR